MPNRLTANEGSLKKLHYLQLGWKAEAAMREKAREGRPPGRAPLGYLLSRGKAIPDPERTAIVARAFAMAASGESLRATLREVTERGLRSMSGKPLGLSALHAILKNPFYAGLIRYQGQLYPGQHEPLVSKTAFEQVQRKLRIKRY